MEMTWKWPVHPPPSPLRRWLDLDPMCLAWLLRWTDYGVTINMAKKAEKMLEKCWVDDYWCIYLMIIDVFWCILMIIDVYWWLLMIIDVYWWLLMYIDDHWCILMYETSWNQDLNSAKSWETPDSSHSFKIFQASMYQVLGGNPSTTSPRFIHVVVFVDSMGSPWSQLTSTRSPWVGGQTRRRTCQLVHRKIDGVLKPRIKNTAPCIVGRIFDLASNEIEMCTKLSTSAKWQRSDKPCSS